MHRILAGLTALALGIPAASAQTPTQSQFEQAALLLIGACNRAEPTKDAAGAISACEEFLANMVQAKTEIAPATPHDMNIDRVTGAMATIRIGRSYAVQDGARTARVCTQMESAWTLLAGSDASASPAYAGMLTNLVNEQAGSVRQCRAEFGSPPGAAPLPQ